jgi:hypothetical protein
MSSYPLHEFNSIELDGLDFCSRVYRLFESIRSAIGGESRLRLRPTDVEKKLLEELLPICRYVQASYGPGRYISVRWIDGSQGFDAEIRQHGMYVELGYQPAVGFLEVTCTMHPKDYLLRELLDSKGIAFGPDGLRRVKGRDIESVPVTYANRHFVEAFARTISSQIEKKSRIVYPDETTLIVQCTLDRPYMPDEWDELMALVTASLPPNGFREIYLFDTVCHYSKSVFPQ